MHVLLRKKKHTHKISQMRSQELGQVNIITSCINSPHFVNSYLLIHVLKVASRPNKAALSMRT